MGSLTWNASDTAELYIVTAETTGHKVLLSTNETWTFLSELHCGEKYFLSVQAHDSVCKSLPSPPLMLESGRLLFHLISFSDHCSKSNVLIKGSTLMSQSSRMGKNQCANDDFINTQR